MANKDKKRLQRDSTTDFFLNFVQKEKSIQETNQAKLENFEEKKDKTMNVFYSIFNSINLMLDKMLSNKYSLRILSFILAIVLFMTFSGGDVLNSTSSGTTIKNVAVKVEGLQNGYHVTGVPESVTIGLIGPSLDIYAQQLTRNYEVYVDLREYRQGSHTVSLKTRNFDSDLTVMVLPDTCNITISPLVKRTFPLETQFENENQLDEKYSVKVTGMSKDKVSISGSESNLDKIEKVAAIIDVGNKASAFSQTCQIKAFDSAMHEVSCQISPDVVTVNCSVDTYSKIVTVVPILKGKVASGYKVTHYRLSPSTVTIYGKKSNIVDISKVKCQVDVNGLSGSTKLTGLTIEQNDKITKMSDDTIDIDLVIEKI